MINVICTSNFDDLNSIRESVLKLGHEFKHKPIVDIELLSLSTESLNQIGESNICIFQSKNAAIQVKDHHSLFNKNKDYYAVGVFTAKSVETSIKVSCKYPKKNYSSKDLIEEYELKNMVDKKVVIFKGEGGLSTIRNELQKKNIVNEIITYKRIVNKNIIKSNDFKSGCTNIVISMSKDALNSLCDNHFEIIKTMDSILIVPNDRFINEKIKVFRKIYVLKSSQYKKEILNIIKST